MSLVTRHRPWRIVRAVPPIRLAVTGHATLLCGDSRSVLMTLADNSIDSIVTDPPYALVSIVKRFGNPDYQPAKGNQAFVRASRGFMGQKWDTGDTSHSVEFWRECLRVLKPGGYLLAMGGTRTYHRLACAIEDAGFDIRDMVQWLYGSGFPKSHNHGDGWGTALKPACEPICMARKPLSEDTIAANVLRWGTGSINIGGCRIESEGGRARIGEASQDRRYTENGSTNFAATPGPRGGAADGRWPANVITDGSDEVMAAFPNAKGQQGIVTGNEPSTTTRNIFGLYNERAAAVPRRDSGSAARFFYQAKATKKDRAGSKHPTVKPVALMRYLCRLITPRGGTVLDPFAGTGTTGEAAHLEGFKVIMIEREAEYQQDIRNRMAGLNVELTDAA